LSRARRLPQEATVTDKPLHTDAELREIVLSEMVECIDRLAPDPVAIGRAVEASTVAKLAAAGDWEAKWYRVLAQDCAHDGGTHPRQNLVCGDCALQLAREAVAEVQAAHQERRKVSFGSAWAELERERDEWKARAEAASLVGGADDPNGGSQAVPHRSIGAAPERGREGWPASVSYDPAGTANRLTDQDLASVRALIEAAHHIVDACVGAATSLRFFAEAEIIEAREEVYAALAAVEHLRERRDG